MMVPPTEPRTPGGQPPPEFLAPWLTPAERPREVEPRPQERPPTAYPGVYPELAPLTEEQTEQGQELLRSAADILRLPWDYYLKPLFEGLYELAKVPERGLLVRGAGVLSATDSTSTALAMLGLPPRSLEDLKAEVGNMLRTGSLRRPVEMEEPEEIEEFYRAFELGEIGYSLIASPEKYADARRMLEDGAPMAEIMKKHENLALELTGNIILDPAWLIPPALFEKALPVSKALKIATKALKKVPGISHLITTTKAGRLRAYSYAISDSVDRFMLNMPEDENVLGWMGRLLLMDEEALATLGRADQVLLKEASATFKRSDYQWRAVISKYSPEVLAGMPSGERAAAQAKIAQSLKALAERIIQKAAPEYVDDIAKLLERDPRKIGRWVAEALTGLKGRELGVAPLATRGIIQRSQAFTAQLWKESILPINIAFHQVNLIDSSLRMALRGYFWNPGDLPVINRILTKLTGRQPLEARVASELAERGLTLPRELQTGLVRELMDTEGYRLKTRYRMPSIPIPFIGKPKSVISAFQKLTSWDVVAWAANAAKKGGLRGKLGKAVTAVRFEDAIVPIAQLDEMGKGYEYFAKAVNRLNLASLVEAGAEHLNIEPLVRITTFWKESEPLFNRSRLAIADLVETEIIARNAGREAIAKEIGDQIRNPHIVQSVADLGDLLNRYIADAGPKLDAFLVSFAHSGTNRVVDEIGQRVTEFTQKPTTADELGNIFAYGRHTAEEKLSRVVAELAPEEAAIEQLRLAGAPDYLSDDVLRAKARADAAVRQAYQRMGRLIKPLEGVRGSDLSFFELGRSVNTRVHREVWQPHWHWYNNEYWPAFQARLDAAKAAGDTAEVSRLWESFRETVRPAFDAVGDSVAKYVDDMTRKFLEDVPADELIKALGVTTEELAAKGMEAIEAPGLVERILQQETEKIFAENASTLERARALYDDTLAILGEMEEQALARFDEAWLEAERIPQVLAGLGEIKDTAMRQMADGYEGAVQQGLDTVDELFYNYARRKGADELLWWASPFTVWQTRNPFGWAKAIAHRPAIVNVIRRTMEMAEKEREEKALTGRFQGTISIPQAITDQMIEKDLMPFPQGTLVSADIRSFYSIWQQLPTLRGDLPWGWEEEPLVGKIIRAGEFVGIRTYPWWQIPLERMGAYGSVPAGDLTYINKYIRAVTKALGHEVDIEKPLRDWRDRNEQNGIAVYYGNLRLLDYFFDEEIAMEDLVRAVSNPEDELFGKAYQEALDWHFHNSLVRGIETFSLKFATPAEQRARLLNREYWELPEDAKEAFREKNPLLLAYWAILRDPEEAGEARIRQARSQALEAVRETLAVVIARTPLGSKAYQDIVEQRRTQVDQILGIFPYEEIPLELQSALRQQATMFFNLGEDFFDEDGNIKDEDLWPQLYAEREAFLKELEWKVPSEHNLPSGRLEFERYLRKNDMPSEAILRAWEMLYGQDVWDVINEQRDNEDRAEANRLITEAKAIADGGRKDIAGLISKVALLHPDWTAEQLFEAKAAAKKIVKWNTWARRKQPLDDALWSMFWERYMAMPVPDKKEFQTHIREMGGPQMGDIFEKVILPKEREELGKTWLRDKALVPTKALIALVEGLEGMEALGAEGFRAEIERVREEIGLEEPIGPYERLPAREVQDWARWQQLRDWFFGLPEDQRPPDFWAIPEVERLNTKFGNPASNEWWTQWYDVVPPGPSGRSLLDDDPVIAFVLDKVARGEEDLVDNKHYQAATKRAKEFMAARPRLRNMGTPEEYELVRDIVNWIYETAREYGEEGSAEYKDAVGQGWDTVRAHPEYGPIIDKYYPPRTSGRPPGKASPPAPEQRQTRGTIMPEVMFAGPGSEYERMREHLGAEGFEYPPDHPATVPVHDPALKEQMARQEPSWPGDNLNPEETEQFRGWAFKEAGFTPGAQEELAKYELNVKRSVGAGGGWDEARRVIELGAPQLEVAIHECAHAYWGTQRDERKDALIEAVMRLAEEADPQYELAAHLADIYINGDPQTGFKGMKLSESVLSPSVWGYGPEDVWNDEEMFAGLASGVMGHLEELPPYIRTFYEGLFTGETGEYATTDKTVPYADFWPAMAIKGSSLGTQGPSRGGGRLLRTWEEFRQVAGPEIVQDLENRWNPQVGASAVSLSVAATDYLYSLYQQYPSGQASFTGWLEYLRALREK